MCTHINGTVNVLLAQPIYRRRLIFKRLAMRFSFDAPPRQPSASAIVTHLRIAIARSMWRGARTSQARRKEVYRLNRIKIQRTSLAYCGLASRRKRAASSGGVGLM